MAPAKALKPDQSKAIERTMPPDRASSPRLLALAPGLGLSVAVAMVASLLGHIVPVVGAPVFAIVIGMTLASRASGQRRFDAGIAFASRRVLQAAIVALGAELSITQVLRTGLHSLPVMLGTVGLTLLTAALVGRLLGLRGDHQLLIGIGTAICGASAIAATTAVIDAAGIDVAYAISTIFIFNVVAVLTYPAIGHLLGLSQHAFGMWAGTAINDISSVAAASTIYGHVAASYAIVVKLTRTLMIVPIVLVLAAVRLRDSRRAETAPSRLPWRRIVPWFIGWFLLSVIANSLGLVPRSWHGGLSSFATLLITVALAAVGLSARFAKMRQMGLRPLALGAILWLTVGVGSLLLQALLLGLASRTNA